MSSYALHSFSAAHWDSGSMPFCPRAYSRLKFGDDMAAREFGHTLAQGFFAAHGSALAVRPTVVIPSPYNYVRNAATVMSRHFVDRLNHLLVDAGHAHVDFSIIHRKVSYTQDYGFMSQEQRHRLIADDVFYLNDQFYLGKTLVFVDDIKITGTHEKRLRSILAGNGSLSQNESFYVYYAQLTGESSPDIEGALNFSDIKTLAQYLDLAARPNHHVIVRPIKFLLGRDEHEFQSFLDACSPEMAREIYHGCLGEGYYNVPGYRSNFLALKRKVGA